MDMSTEQDLQPTGESTTGVMQSTLALKLQALLTPESAAALCAHLCVGAAGGGAELRATQIVAAVLRGPSAKSLKASIGEQLLRHMRDSVARVEATVAVSDALTVHLQAAGHESLFLQLLQTLHTLFQESGEDGTMTLQDLLNEAHAERIWVAVDAALARTAEQWPEGEESEFGSEGTPPTVVPPLLHRLLPLVEAFFLVHEAKGPGARSEPEGCAPEFPSEQDGAREESAPRTAIAIFGERHRRTLNALVRQSPSLLSGSFSALVEGVPWSLDFDNKRHYLRQRLRALRGDLRYGIVRLHVRRSEVFMDSYHQLRMRSSEEMRGKLSVSFIGEEAMDAGGVAREWFKILAREIFNPNYGLFTRAGGKACTFHPSKTSHVNPDHLSFFQFIGRIIGKALFDGHYLEAYFTRSFYKHMLRRKVNYTDMEALDPDYYRNLRWMFDNSIEGAIFNLNFTAESDEFGRVRTVELKPGGANMQVTDENKQEYVQLMCEHKMTKSVQAQINAFLEGFQELVPPQLISLFDDKELELLISGLPDIDIDDLRQNTDYHNYTDSSPCIEWFWKVLGECSKEHKAWFLQFVTGTSQVPLEGFKGLIGMRGPQKFSVHRAEGGERLPTAHTCFNQLDLPEYSSEETLRRKLMQAVHEAHEGFGFV